MAIILRLQPQHLARSEAASNLQANAAKPATLAQLAALASQHSSVEQLRRAAPDLG